MTDLRLGLRDDGGLWLRPARAFDAASCAAIVDEWIERTPWVPRRHTAGEIGWFYRERVFREQQVTIAERHAETIGFLALDFNTLSVTSLYVAAKARRAGVGARLLDHAKAQAPRLSLWAFRANLDARRFYLREGFREGRRSDGDNEETLPDIEFLWDAPGSARRRLAAPEPSRPGARSPQ